MLGGRVPIPCYLPPRRYPTQDGAVTGLGLRAAPPRTAAAAASESGREPGGKAGKVKEGKGSKRGGEAMEVEGQPKVRAVWCALSVWGVLFDLLCRLLCSVLCVWWRCQAASAFNAASPPRPAEPLASVCVPRGCPESDRARRCLSPSPWPLPV